MRRIITSFIIALSLITSLLGSTPLLAQGIGGAGDNLDVVANKAGTTQGDISLLAGQVINAILSMVGLIFLGLMVYAGMMWMTARGDDSKIEKAQGIIEACLIGLVITIAAYAITVFVTGRFQS